MVGRDKVLRYLLSLRARPEAAQVTGEIAEVNGEPALLLWLAGDLVFVLVPEVVGERVAAVRIVVNTRKLGFAARQLV